MAKQIERRKTDRTEDAETWAEDERKAIVKLGPLFEKFVNRHGTPKKEESKSFLEELGIKL
jgi:hypothetical protein